ncbi:MAG: sensor histidine kinase [Arcobacteraceae bacterium]|nr:sensor histidine kinase [Arcobacteraceae bacterium]
MKIKLFVVFIFIVIAYAISYLTYQSLSDEEVVKQLSIQKAEIEFKERDELLSDFINKFDQTLVGIEENKYFINFIQNNYEIEHINELFLSSIKSLPSVVQFRYIDKLGNEIIRVDKIDKHSFIVPKDKLQNKKNRYYFEDIYNIKENGIWHSKIDLNIEHGKITIPIQPTLRVGSLVVIDGIKKGILIINIDVSVFLNKLKNSSVYNIYVIDKDGDFLVHFDKKYSWGKYLKTNINIFNHFNHFTKDLLLKDEVITENFYSKQTTFKNDDGLIIIIEPKKSQILEEIKLKSKNRLYWILLIILIAISAGYIIFKRRQIQLVEQHSEELVLQKQKIQNLLDAQKSIIILTNGIFIQDCNKRFLDFFGYKTLVDFTKEHDCICDFFEADDNYDYLQKMMSELVWTDYILANKNKIHKVKITNINNHTHIFQVNAKMCNYSDELQESIITFSDVTQLDKLNKNLEEANKSLLLKTIETENVSKKVHHLNITLEKRVKKEVEKSKLIQNKLFKTEKMAAMGEMIGNIAHQWRQPLSVISIGATGLKLQKELGTLTDKFFFKTCDMINDNAQYLSKTIDDFRNFIKGDRKIENFDLKDDIDSFLHLIEASINNHNINLILELQKDIRITGYPNELIQCFINIFNNSKDILKELDEEDRLIFITTYTNNDKIFIKFKDSGGGIPDKVLSKIFDPYFTTKHQAQGTGLGLHMTYTLIVDGMNGNIEARNNSYEYNGKSYTGAEFTITLPIS